VNSSARDAERLSRPYVDPLAINRPGEHPLDTVNGLFVVVVAVRWRRQSLRGRNREFKERNAATRVA
jgi:hypothetical protein